MIIHKYILVFDVINQFAKLFQGFCHKTGVKLFDLCVSVPLCLVFNII